ncbi:MAG: transcriptional regulator, partial [Gammaproteobacteria bacterium]|nr:transcriptional regulator [Gammaproteobacteria bacterium]
MPGRDRPGAFGIGDWVVDPLADELLLHGRAIKLEPRMMRLLVCLARSEGQVVSSQRLLDEVWAGVVVSPGSLYEAISHLRKTLGDTESPPRYIATVARKGYRLVAPVHWRKAPPQPSPQPSPEAAATLSRQDSATAPLRTPPRRRAMVVALILVSACALAWLGASRYSTSVQLVGALPAS